MVWSTSKPVIVPFDFSDYALAALRKAATIVENPKQIYVVHVLPFMIPTEPGVVWATVDDGSRIQHAKASLAEAISVKEFGNVSFDVRLGDPGHVVADIAEELGADLIVLGSHGRTGITRLVLGSVAERVTRLAQCPVLVVKLPVEAVKASEASHTDSESAKAPKGSHGFA